MIIVMKEAASPSQIQAIIQKLKDQGYDVHPDRGASRTVLGVIGDTRKLDPRNWEMEEGVSEVFRVTEPYKLVNRSFHPENSVIQIQDVTIGGDGIVVMAGPCSVEGEKHVHT